MARVRGLDDDRREVIGPVEWGESVTEKTTGFVLPAGTVTLLLSDIEGSTKLWESRADEMNPAIGRLNELVDEAIGVHGGVRPLEQGEGDSFLAAFSRASEAVACALAVQRALTREAGPIAVRIGIHTGEVQQRGEANYVGTEVNRCARLRETAHGGQIVVSRTTHDLVADRLPEGATLRDLGTHRLRDLSRPEHIFQLEHPDLRSEFPPLRSLDAVPNNLPVQLTSFVGRQAEIAEVSALLGDARMVTLTGGGGCGKTRLAVQVAARVLDTYPDGIWFVDFAPVSDPELVPQTVAIALGFKQETGRDFLETLVAHLGQKTVLVVLDNCEHLVAAIASLAETLLRGCAGLSILATSREPLGVPSEVTWRVPNLSAPEKRASTGIEAVTQYEAVQLFVDRAKRARPSFAVTDDNAPAVAQICHRVDGIPLAIELAAARCRMLSPQQICDGLVRRFELLTGGARTVVPRQQTLRASMDWSHDLLSEEERILLRRLSVFAGGFTLEAADVVCGEGVLDVLSQLVDRSLVVVDENDVAARYRMLETVRQYAHERLVEASEDNELRDRHLEYFVDLGEATEPDLYGWRQVEAFALLDAEQANMAAALDWAETSGRTEQGLRLAAALWLYWYPRGVWSDGRRRYERLLEAGDAIPANLHAAALSGLSSLAMSLGDFAQSKSAADKSFDLARRGDDKRIQVRAMLHRASFAEPELSRSLLPECVTLAREADDIWTLCQALAGVGFAEFWFGDPEEGLRAAVESIEVARAAGDRASTHEGLVGLGASEAYRGNLPRARESLDAGLDVARDYCVVCTAGALSSLSMVATWSGDHELARMNAEEAVSLSRTSGFVGGIQGGLIALGMLALAQDDASRATAHFEDAVASSRSMGSYAAPYLAPLLSIASEAALAAGDITRARSYLEEANTIGSTARSRWDTAAVKLALARVAVAEGDDAAAESLLHETLLVAVELGARRHIIEIIEELAAIAARQESYAEAARLYAAAHSERERTGLTWRKPDDELVSLREVMGDEFETAWDDGLVMSLDDTVAYAQRGRGERKRPSSGWASLTPTEIEVVKLVREGLTNPQIADRLFISRNTARSHLQHIFAKLGVSTRAELAAAATRRNI